MRRSLPRHLALGAIFALVLAQSAASVANVARAASGDLIADVVVPEPYPRYTSPSVASDGRYLYYTEYGGSTLHRIDIPPAGSSGTGTGEVDAPIQGAPSGIMTLSYDAGRDAFWAVGSDALSIYLLSKTGAATLMYRVDSATDRPGFVPVGDFPNEIKIAYDGTDDTIWYSSDAGVRIYHYHTYADADGTAVLVSATPYIDVNVAPNDMQTECGFSQSSGVATGGTGLFVTISGCNYLFEFTKTGTKVAAYLLPYRGPSTQDLECDDQSYSVAVFWIRDGYDGHIRAFEQPSPAP